METRSTDAMSYGRLDEALEVLAAYGPDLSNGMTNHAPMVVEALCALHRPDAIMPWLDHYRTLMLPLPAAYEPIAPHRWREALGQAHRFGDWRAFFAAELAEGPWPEALDRWVMRLAPGICAAATHGVIRVGHAVRSLAIAETPARRRELADALASWAYAYQELPTVDGGATAGLTPEDAIARVPVVPPAERRFHGTIVSSLDALSEVPAFAPVIHLLDVRGEPGALIPPLTEVFARVYLANAHDFLTTIVFIHGVTSIAALGALLPHLRETTARAALRFGWQAGCGLYAAFGDSPRPADDGAPPSEDEESLVDRAVASGDDHAIKFTAACLQQHALRPSPAYLAAARHAVDGLGRS